jgi:hypothetical protein
MASRSLGRWVLGAVGSLAGAALLVYLLRWPLFGSLVRDEVHELVGRALHADPDIGSLGGDLLSGIVAKRVTLTPLAGAPFVRARADRVEVDYGFLGLGELRVTVVGARVELAGPGPGSGGPRPPEGAVPDALEALRSFEFPGRLLVRDSKVILPDGRDVRILRGALRRGSWDLLARTEGAGSVDLQARFEPGGALRIRAEASDGPLSHLRILMRDAPGPLRPLTIEAEVARHPLRFEGTARMTKAGLASVKGTLSADGASGRLSLDLPSGRVSLSLAGAVPIRHAGLDAVVGLRVRLEGPLAGAAQDWTVHEADLSIRDGSFRSLRFDRARLVFSPGNASRLPWQATVVRGDDHLGLRGTLRWSEFPDIDATVRLAVEDLAPYLRLMRPEPPLDAREVRIRGRFRYEGGSPSFEGRIGAGRGSVQGRSWDEVHADVALSTEALRVRSLSLRGLPVVPRLEGSASFEKDHADRWHLEAFLRSGEDSLSIAGEFRSAEDLQIRLKFSGSPGGILPSALGQVNADGRVVRREDLIRLRLSIEAQGCQLDAPEVRVRRQQAGWQSEWDSGSLRLRDGRVLRVGEGAFDLESGMRARVRLAFHLDQPSVDARIQARASWSPTAVSVEASAPTLSVGGRSLTPLLLRASLDRAREEIDLDLRWGVERGDHLLAAGRLGPTHDLRLDLRIDSLDSHVLETLFPSVDLGGGVSLLAHVGGTRGRPDVAGALHLRGVSIGKVPPITLAFPFDTVNDTLMIRESIQATPFGRLSVKAAVPLEPNRELSVDFHVDHENLELLTDQFVPSARIRMPGATMSARASVRGTLRKPLVRGDLTIEARTLVPPPPFGRIRELQLRASADPGGVELRATGVMGYGPLRLDGSWHWDRPDGALRARLAGRRLLVVEDALSRVRASPDLTLSRDVEGRWRLSGTIDVPLVLSDRELGGSGAGETPGARAVSVPRLALPQAPGGGILLPGVRTPAPIGLDIRILAAGELRVENSVVGALLEGEARLQGTAEQPAVSGAVRARSGEIKLATGIFVRIEEARADVPADPQQAPSIHFKGRVGYGESSILVLVEGPLSRPTLILESNPPRPQQELLAYLAFGRLPGELTEGQALSTLAVKVFEHFTDAWPQAEPEVGLLERLSLDAVDPENPVERRLPWELTPIGTARGTIVRTEYVLNRFISIVAEAGSEGDVGGNLKLRVSFR